MPAPPTKAKKFESLTKFLQKRFKGVPVPAQRPVLDHLIYAALLENAAFEQADQAFVALEHYYIDWNEMRVSTVSELADVIPMLPDPANAAERVRRTLQGVFDKTYSFELEELKKKGKNLSQSCAFIESIRGCTPFMVAYTTQVALDGHLVPLDEASLRVFRLLGLAQVNKEGTKEEVPGLERAIPKKNGLPFAVQLHHFAAGYFGDPENGELRTLLKPIDPEAVTRSWQPPALTVPKDSVKTEKKPRPAEIPALPFPAADVDIEDLSLTDDAEDVFIEEEKELIEEIIEKPKNKPVNTVKKPQGKQEKNSPKSVKPQPQSVKAKPQPPKEDSKTVVSKAVVKKPDTKTQKAPQKPPVKPAAKQSKKPQPKLPAKPATKPSVKSPTRQLRSKKPK